MKKSKNNDVESELNVAIKRKMLTAPSITAKKKSRPKRSSVTKEQERRRLDGRAEAVEVDKMKKAPSIFQSGSTKPSTPEEIGKLLASATK